MVPVLSLAAWDCSEPDAQPHRGDRAAWPWRLQPVRLESDS